MSGQDITGRADVERLVDGFYDRVRRDEILGPIFDDIAHTEWAAHLPRMYDFWQTVLFGVDAFHGNPLAVHLLLARRVPLGEHQFGRWLELFHANVDALFSGAMAEEAKRSAERIAGVMRQRIASDEAGDRPVLTVTAAPSRGPA